MNKFPQKIVLFDQYPFLGGGQVVLLSVVEVAAKIARHVSVVVPFGGTLVNVLRGTKKSNASLNNIPPCEVGHGRKSWRDLIRLGLYNLRLLIRYGWLLIKSDLVYANGPRQFPGLLVMSWLFRKSCVYHIHIDHSEIEKKLIALAAGLKSTHRIIVNSDYVLDRLETSIPGFKENPRVTVIENALNPRLSALQFVDRFSGCGGKLKVAVIGTLRPEKGQDRAVRLALQNNGVEVHLVGRTGHGADTWVADLKRDAPINSFFHEEVSDIPAWIEQVGIQVVLVPSRWQEPFGLVAIEGMACSCIAIVWDSGALPNIASKTGALVCEDEGNLLDVIGQLATMPSVKRLSIARNQYEKTIHLYGAERFTRAIQQVLQTSAT